MGISTRNAHIEVSEGKINFYSLKQLYIIWNRTIITKLEFRFALKQGRKEYVDINPLSADHSGRAV
jgi:hypothetical protein